GVGVGVGDADDRRGPAVALGRARAEARLGDLAREVEARHGRRRRTLADPDGPAEPRVLVVLDGARRLRALPGAMAVLQDGPAVGVHVLCVDDDQASLPAECRATAVVDPAVPTRALVRGPGVAPVADVLLD